VAHHDGLVVVLDTALTPELVAEGDARELARAIQELRREAGLALDDRIDLWVGLVPPAVSGHLGTVATDTLAELVDGDPPSGATHASVELDGGPVAIALRRRTAGRGVPAGG
jgi:isoleucyl-tRNA synthetase